MPQRFHMTGIHSNAPVPPFAGREIYELAAKGDASGIANTIE